MYAVQPSLFFTLGARNETPGTYFMTGLGLSLGYTNIRGVSYLTEDQASVSALCWQAGEDVVAGALTGVQSIKSECNQESYHDSGWGTGGRIFMGGRYKNMMMDFNAANMIIASQQDFLNPIKMSITLSYVINI